MNSEKINAGIYFRVSTMEQATEGYSLEAQERKMIDYVKYQNFNLAGKYKDEGISGASMNRPSLQRLINDVKIGKINYVIIYKLDRLSRRLKDVIDLVDLFIEKNVTLYSLSENIDLSSPFGRAALKIAAIFSELERETITERMKFGKEERARSGRMMCPGNNVPFGYRYNKEKEMFEIDKKEAEIINEIFDLYLKGYSFRKLNDYFHNKYPDIKTFNNPMSCKPIIQRPTYAGYYKFKGEIYKGSNFEPIITYEKFIAAQTQVENNKTARKHDNSPYLLTGKILCGECGNRFVGKLYDRYTIKADGSKSKHYIYTVYGCAARIKRDKKYMPVICKNKIIHTDYLENYLESLIRKISFDKKNQKNNDNKKILLLEEELTNLKSQSEKLLDLYLTDLLDKELYLNKQKKLDKNIASIEKKISNLKNEKNSLSEYIDTDKLNLIFKNFSCLSKKQKSCILFILIKNIVIYKDKIVIEWNIEL